MNKNHEHTTQMSNDHDSGLFELYDLKVEVIFG